MVVATRPVEKDRIGPRLPSDNWQQGRRSTKGVPPPETAWGEDRIMPSSNSSQAAVQADIELLNNQVDHTESALAADKKHVTFHIEQQQPAARRQPIKVMMRDMKSGTRDDNEQAPTDALHHSSMGKPPYHPRASSDSDTQIVNDKQLPAQRVSAWKGDRGPITTPRTLYEPEGDKSAKKFNALIKQTVSDRAKRSSVSDTVQDEQIPSPSGDIKILKSDDKHAKSKQQQSSAPPTNSETNKETADQKPQQSSGKTRHDSSSSRKGSKKDRPAVRQYQPPPARNQDEQVYPSENKAGGSRRTPRYQEYNFEGRHQRRKDSGQHFEGKHHPEGKQHKTGGKHPSQAEEKHSEGKHQSYPEGKRHSYFEGTHHAHSEGKHLDSKHQSHSEGKHYEGKHVDVKHQEGKHPDGKHQSQPEGKHQKQHHSEERHVRERPKKEKDTKDLPSSQEEPQPQEDAEKSKQSGKEPHNKTAGEAKQQKKKSSSSISGGQKETTGAKARSFRGRNRNDDWGYYNDEYYNDYQWYGSNYDYYNYGDYEYDYDYQREYYPDQRRGPSGRSRQQHQSTSSTSEKKDSTNRRSQQSTSTGRPPRTRKDDSRKDEPSDGVDKTQQHKGSKNNDEDKPLPEVGADNRRRRTDSRQQQQQDNDKRRFAKSGSGGGSSSKGPAGRGTGTNKTSPSLDQRPVEDLPQKATTKKDAAVKEKAPSRMVNVDINSPNVVVIDEDVATPLSPNSAGEVDDFIRVTSKKEKREMKEQEKHRQQEKQRKAEEEENKKKHSSKKSHKSKQHQQQNSSYEQPSQQGEAQPVPSNSWTTATTITTQSSSIWSDSYTNLLSEGVHHPNYTLIRPPGDYQLFPTSFNTTPAVPLAHLSAAVDSSVAQELPSSASQSHTLSETEKVTNVERQDPGHSGRGVRTDLPLSKSHSSMSVGGTIGRGRGSSSRAPGSNRGVSSSNKVRNVMQIIIVSNVL